MNTTSQFTSNFWNIYIAAIVVLSFVGLAWLLLSQNKTKMPPKGEDVKTMGHSWDGIEEYNNPLPRWWFYLFVLTMVFSAAYLFLYPGLGDYKGYLNWTSQNQYEKEVQKANEQYGKIYAKFANMPIEEVAKDPQAQRIGKNMFDTYCIQCHGSDAKGSKGFPNLTDGDWLWGGSPEQIHETIAKGRTGVMTPMAAAVGSAEDVGNLSNYVVSLSGGPHDSVRASLGKSKFVVCAACHGADGKGNQALGAPNLTDKVWLWADVPAAQGDEAKVAAIRNVISGGLNKGVMPAWAGRLSPEQIKVLTVYVHELGGGL